MAISERSTSHGSTGLQIAELAIPVYDSSSYQVQSTPLESPYLRYAYYDCRTCHGHFMFSIKWYEWKWTRTPTMSRHPNQLQSSMSYLRNLQRSILTQKEVWSDFYN